MSKLDKIPYFLDYLKRFSEQSKKQYRNKLTYFQKWVGKNRGKYNLLQVNYDDVVAFFNEDISERKIKIESKENWRIHLKSYYEYIRKVKMKEASQKNKKYLNFINPVPDSDLYTFHTKREIVTVNDVLEVERYMEYKDAKKILIHYYETDFQLFIICGLLLYTGARISEVMSLLDEQITLKDRFIINLIKRTKFVDKYGVYFFPEFFVKYLKMHIDLKKELYPESSYLFPSKKKINSHISVRSVQDNLVRVKKVLMLDVKNNPHAFRKCINQARFHNGVAPLKRTILLNHTPKDIEAKHYIPDLEQIIEKREIYDKAFPFPELKIKKF